ncbi:MAG: metallophosphoesterase [Clostridia bacterium]|nr:metallophosphoesterase [Clostridia bacterium]
MRVSKRLLSVLLAVLLVLAALPLSAAAKTEAKKELLLATISDVHYFPESLAGYKGEAVYNYVEGFNCVYENLNGIIDSAFDALAKDAVSKGLKYVVACGDLTTNGEYEGHVALAEKFRKLEQDTGLKVFVISGNHDLNNPDASEFNSPDGKRHEAKRTTAADFYDIYYDFGFDEAVSTFSAPDTGRAGALSYSLVVDGYRLIMIDAGKYTADNTDKKRDLKETGGNITPELYSWVEAQAAQAKKNGETPLAFTHWNLSEMNYLHGEVLQGFVIDNAYKLQEQFADMGIHYVFSGHQHVSDIDVTYSDSGEPLYSVITPILTQFPYSFRETLFESEGGKVSAHFDMYNCDVTKNVVSDSGEEFSAPYKYSGFKLQFGGSPEKYLMSMIKGLLGKYVEDIKQSGSIVQMIKDDFDFDLRDYLDKLIKGGLSIADVNIFTVDNLMSFIADLDSQIVKTYIYNTDRLWNALETAITKLVNVKVSDLPCTKFISDYGFGSKTQPGTLGDAFFSAMVYMYNGNEDSSDDAFIKDVIRNASQPEFVDLIFGAAKQYVVLDFVVDELLANLYVRLGSLYAGTGVSNFLHILYKLITGVTTENIFTSTSVLDFVKKLIDIATKVTYDDSATTYKYLLDYVLGTGLIKYGSNASELIDYVLDQYFDQKNKEATAYQLYVVLRDVYADEDLDWGVSYNYRGPVKVTPTVEDMQLPNDVNVQYKDGNYVFHWLTKYSVTGSDIVISEKGTGKAVAKENIKSKTEKDVYSGNGFSFGSFGFLPWTREINAHSVSVSGLTKGKTYTFKIGDASKSFWSASGEIYVPKDSGETFTFLFMNDIAAPTPAGYETWAKTLDAAEEKYDSAFVMLSGPSVLNGKDDAQFSCALNSALNTLTGLPLYYASGAADVADVSMAAKHYGSTPSDRFADSATGCYYSFDWGDAHFAVLNANDLESDGTLKYYQIDWLKEDLVGSSAHWKIVMLSKPLVGGENVESALSKQLLPMLSYGQCDLILQGGENAYYRSNMVRQGSFLDDTDVIIKNVGGGQVLSLVSKGLVAVSAGTAGNYPSAVKENCEGVAACASQNNPMFVAVTVSGEDLIIRACEADSLGKTSVIDEVYISKSEKSLLLGDIDLDSRITAADARLALRYAVKLEKLTAYQKLAANVDRDDAITASDARLILRAAVKLEKIRPENLVYTDVDLKNVKL